MPHVISSTADASFVESSKKLVHGYELFEHTAEHFAKIAQAVRPGSHICNEQAEAFFFWLNRQDGPDEVDIDTKKGRSFALTKFVQYVDLPAGSECLH